MGKSINCNSFRREFLNFLRVRREILDHLALGLGEKLPEECRRNEIARNHLLRKILGVIIAVLLRPNPTPRDLSVICKGIHRTRRNHRPLVVTLAMLIHCKRTLLLTSDSIRIPEPANAATRNPCGGNQTDDDLRRTKDKIHYFTVIPYL